MGKPSEAQIKEKAVKDQRVRERRATAVPVPIVVDKIVTVKLSGDDDLVFDGAFDVQVTPSGVLCVVELVPDVGNKNSGVPTPTIREFVNSNVWRRVILK